MDYRQPPILNDIVENPPFQFLFPHQSPHSSEIEVDQKAGAQGKMKKRRPLLTFKILYFDHDKKQLTQQMVKGRSVASIVFRYSYYSANGFQKSSRSDIRYPACRLCGTTRQCKGGNTTEMLRHIRSEHPKLQEILQQKFLQGSKRSCYFLNLCQDERTNRMFQINEISQPHSIENQQKLYDYLQEQRRRKFCYKIHNDGYEQQPNYGYSHEKGLFSQFPTRIKPKFELKKGNPMVQLNRPFLGPKNKNIYIQEQKREQAYPTNFINNIEYIQDKKLIAHIYYPQQKQLPLYNRTQKCDSLFIFHYSATTFPNQHGSQLIYICTQNTNGYPFIPVIISLINQITLEQITGAIQYMTVQIFPMNKWPQYILYCGDEVILQSFQNVIELEKQKYKQNYSQYSSLEPQKIYKIDENWIQNIHKFDREILLSTNHQLIKTHLLTLYRQIIQKQHFYGYMLTTSFIYLLTSKIRRSFTAPYTHINDSLKILFSNTIHQDIKAQARSCELYNQSMTKIPGWTTIQHLVCKMYSDAFIGELSEFQKSIHPKIYKKIVILYIYAMHTLVSANIDETRKFQVFEVLKSNPWGQSRVYDVNYNMETHKYECNCGLETILGVPCSHLIRVVVIDQGLIKNLRKYLNPRWIVKLTNSDEVQLEQLYSQHHKQFLVSEYDDRQMGLTSQKEEKFQYYGIINEKMMQNLVLWV